MKGKTIALMTVLTLVFGLSACGDKTASQAEISDTTREEESIEVITDKAEVTTEKKEVTEEEAAHEMTQEEKVQSALGEMPYYGDTANCKMTAEQATAYAQLIADGLVGDLESMLIDASGVILADFAGDGIPYLYLYNNKENYWEDYFEIYGWKDDRAELTFEKLIDSYTLYYLYEDEQGRIKLSEESPLSMSHYITRYSFCSGAMEPIYTYSEDILEDGNMHIMENDVETAVYTPEEYSQYNTPFLGDYVENHNHTLPYTCFYDMTPCTLEEMVNYLNVYASVMSDGRSVPVEIKKADIVRHDGTGIIAIGEVPQEKVCKLEILRQFMSGETGIGAVNDGDAFLYTNGFDGQWEDSNNFYFALTDINNDGSRELKVSYQEADGSWSITNLYLGSSYEDSLYSINGVNMSDGTYLCTGGSVYAIARLYVYDGTTFSKISELNESETPDGAYCYTLTENGSTREISEAEFHSIWNEWESRHTDFSADTHLDILNIENAFQVKIDIQKSGEWLVTSVE